MAYKSSRLCIDCILMTCQIILGSFTGNLSFVTTVINESDINHSRRMSATRSKVLSLYMKMLREAKKFSDYNFRKYAIRRTKDGFHSNKTVSDPAVVQRLIQEAEENLKMMQRQVMIGQLYSEGKLVIESLSPKDLSDSR